MNPTGADITFFDNYRQARSAGSHLPFPEILLSDLSLFDRMFHMHEMLDGIICDPPYGIRAGAKKLIGNSQTNSSSSSSEEEENEEEDGASTNNNNNPLLFDEYTMEQMIVDLFHLAHLALREGGVLVYVLPVPLGWFVSLYV